MLCDALGAHARDELGISETLRARGRCPGELESRFRIVSHLATIPQRVRRSGLRV